MNPAKTSVTGTPTTGRRLLVCAEAAIFGAVLGAVSSLLKFGSIDVRLVVLSTAAFTAMALALWLAFFLIDRPQQK